MKAKKLFPDISFKKLWKSVHPVDNLESTDKDKSLSANMGRELKKDLDEKVPFKLGIDANGNYGYIKAGADSVTPFKNIEIQTGSINITYTSNSWLYITVDFETPFKTTPNVNYSYAAGSTGGSVFVSSVSTTQVKFGYNNFYSSGDGKDDTISWVAYTV